MEEKDLIERIKEHFGHSKDVVTAIDNLKTASTSLREVNGKLEHNLDKTHKLQPVYHLIEVLGRKQIDQKLPLVYIASGFDVEFPLLLGRQNIVLVDPVLKSEKERFIEKVNGLYRVDELKEDEALINFNGKPVNLKIKGQKYEEFNPEERIGILMEYQPPNAEFFMKSHLLAKLVNDGIFYSNAISSDPKDFGFRLEKPFDGCIKGGIYSRQNLTEEKIKKMEELTRRRRKELEDFWSRIPHA